MYKKWVSVCCSGDCVWSFPSSRFLLQKRLQPPGPCGRQRVPHLFLLAVSVHLHSVQLFSDSFTYLLLFLYLVPVPFLWWRFFEYCECSGLFEPSTEQRDSRYKLGGGGGGWGGAIRYSGPVLLRYWHFLPDRVSVRRGQSKSHIVLLLSPTKATNTLQSTMKFSCIIFQVFWSCSIA